MKETKMYQAIMITNYGVEIMRVSKSKKLLNEFVSEYRQQYIKDMFGWQNVEVIRGENSYTVIRTNDKNFMCCWKIVEVRCLEEKKIKIEETAKNDRYAE